MTIIIKAATQDFSTVFEHPTAMCGRVAVRVGDIHESWMSGAEA